VQTRFSPDELAEVEEAARKEAVTVCEYLRQTALKRKLRTSFLDRDAQREIWKQVAGAARNINQIAKRVNTSSVQSIDFVELQKQLQRIIDSMMIANGKKKS